MNWLFLGTVKLLVILLSLREKQTRLECLDSQFINIKNVIVISKSPLSGR